MASVNDLLRCTSKIVYSRRGGYDTLQHLAGALERSFREEGDPVQIQDHLSYCMLAQKNSVLNSPASLAVYVAQISSLPVNEGVKKLLMGFANPKYQCEVIGGHVGVTAYVIGVNSSLDIAFCSSTLGNQWLELRPGGELAFGPGFGVNGGFQTGWDQEKSYTRSPVSVSPRVSLNITALLGFQLVSRGSREPNTFGIDFAAGGKMNFGFGAELRFSVLPLGTNYDKLKIDMMNYQL